MKIMFKRSRFSGSFYSPRRDIVLCWDKLSKYFDIPENVNLIEVHVNDRPSQHSYPVRGTDCNNVIVTTSTGKDELVILCYGDEIIVKGILRGEVKHVSVVLVGGAP